MRFIPAVSLLALAASLGACASTASREAAPAAAAAPAAQASRQIPTQLPRNVRPLQYAISVAPDAQNLRFTGITTIDIEVLEATDRITVNAADLTFKSANLSSFMPDGRVSPIATSTNRIDVDAEKQTATVRFGDPLAPGRYRLTFDYAGKINTQASGLFALDYESATGKKRALFTQFQAPDARRFFPGWDEPQFRTPYNLTVTVPADQDVISNMPQAGVESRGATKTIAFQKTPPMPSYLLFLSVGDFDRITTTAAGTEIGVVTKAGDGEKGRWALEGSAQLLPYYNEYFGTPYPLPKLDNVAGPGSSQFFGAMENWGAIFSFESILLVDPAITTEATRQRIFEVAAHEMAHQWFGNLVTMAWWDDLWLNEGFASWMATKATSDLHPEWEAEIGLVGTRESAMGQDAVVTTHPIVQRLTTVEQISQAFDSITYSKGEAVITMLEDYVGEDGWRKGVQSYMRTHKMGNTQTDDLWRAIEGAAPGKPVRAIAQDFTMQPGVPLIRVENATCKGGKTAVTLKQGEFTRDRPDKQPLSWRVPVIAATVGGAEVRSVVSGGSAAMTVPGCGPLLLNSGQTGYYRTLYTPALLDRLTASFAQLKPIDQSGLLADTWGLGLAGHQSASEALDLIDAVPANANPQVYSRVAGVLGSIHELYNGDPERQAMLGRYASAKLGPMLRKIGWSPKAGEAPTVPVLRSALIATLGATGDAAVVAEANRLYASNDPLATAGGLRTTILSVVSRNIDAGGWERLRAQAQAEKNPLVRASLYRMLGASRDPVLARRALELALTEEPGATTSPGIIGAVAARHPDLAFDFALQNREKVEGLVDVSSRSRFIATLGGASVDSAMIAKIEDYALRYMTPESRRPADQAIGAIRDRVRVRETRLPDITRWLEAKARG